MPCTTILAGRKATYDGSTFMARNEDSPAGEFTPKKFIVVRPEDQPRMYRSVLSGVEIPLPEEPMRYTAVPNALPNEGIWGEAGVNAENVAMSETETITSNPRVLGADPLVPGGIGEEDMLTIVLPYIHSARDGVRRLGALLEQYGTYEMNGIGFQDVNEVWWLESIGGHHWIAKRCPDDAYVVMPNQQGIDFFDFSDALGEEKDHMCSSDLPAFIRENHLDLTMHSEDYELTRDKCFDVRAALGSRGDFDHSYNTPRAWFMERYLNPASNTWDGPDADYLPEADDIPWCRVPEKKLTAEDVKYVLSGHYQGTPYDPYEKNGDPGMKLKYRPIGVNRTNFMSLTQLRPYVPKEIMAIQWIAMGCNVFNAMVPFYANVDDTPGYLRDTDGTVTTDNFYWANRLAAALADSQYHACMAHVERYQNKVHAEGHRMLNESDRSFDPAEMQCEEIEAFNQKVSDMVKADTDKLLDKVLFEVSMKMKNGFSRSDA